MASTTGSPREGERRGRPQSMMAMQFSATLDSIFGLEGPTEHELALEEKKKALETRNNELAELQARIKAMEAKLTRTRAISNAAPAERSVEAVGSARQPLPQRKDISHTLPVRGSRPQQPQEHARSEFEESSEEEEDDEEDNEDKDGDDEEVDEENSETEESTSEEEEEEESEEESPPRTKSR